MEMPGWGGHGDTCAGLTISLGAQSVVVALTLVANRVLHVAICNLRGLWAAVVCKGKQEEEVSVQKLLSETHETSDERKLLYTSTFRHPKWKPCRGHSLFISGCLPRVFN